MNIETTNAQNTTETAIGFIPCYRLPFLSLFHADCMQIMKQYPDKYFDLAIVDPPYGIDDKLQFHLTGTAKNKMYSEKRWDKKTPEADYWKELFRVSKNQIVFGGNYFTDYLPQSRGWFVWHKLHDKNLKYSQVELIYTSFDVATKIKRMNPDSISYSIKSIHPTQKPVGIYEWVLQLFATQKMKILDTHFGSGSIALAVDKANRLDKMNLHLTACEIDLDYVNASIKRISESIKQGTLSF